MFPRYVLLIVQRRFFKCGGGFGPGLGGVFRACFKQFGRFTDLISPQQQNQHDLALAFRLNVGFHMSS